MFVYFQAYIFQMLKQNEHTKYILSFLLTTQRYAKGYEKISLRGLGTSRKARVEANL